MSGLHNLHLDYFKNENSDRLYGIKASERNNLGFKFKAADAPDQIVHGSVLQAPY